MTTRYDPAVIQQFADQLYAQARLMVATYAVLGFLLGGLGMAGFGLTEMGGGSPYLPGLVGGFVFAALLAAVGQSRAFDLRLRAQTALCQVQTEWNSRRQ